MRENKYLDKRQYDVKSWVQVYEDEAFANRIKMDMSIKYSWSKVLI
jgi:hypothetical protein